MLTISSHVANDAINNESLSSYPSIRHQSLKVIQVIQSTIQWGCQRKRLCVFNIFVIIWTAMLFLYWTPTFNKQFTRLQHLLPMSQPTPVPRQVYEQRAPFIITRDKAAQYQLLQNQHKSSKGNTFSSSGIEVKAHSSINRNVSQDNDTIHEPSNHAIQSTANIEQPLIPSNSMDAANSETQAQPILIGRGQFGQVSLAEHEGKLVAIKCMNYTTQHQMMRYSQETLLHNRVQKIPGALKYVVRLLSSQVGSGRDSESAYLMLELCRGGNLRVLAKAFADVDRLIPLPLAIRIANDILMGLSMTHAARVIHRDIKNANVLISLNDDGDIVGFKLADFGLSQTFDEGAVGGRRAGTPSLEAPELWRREPIDSSADIFAFSMQMYGVCTGDLRMMGVIYDRTQRLFKRNDINAAYANREKPWRPPIRAMNDLICPRELQNVIVACWHQDATSRPTDDVLINEVKAIASKYHIDLEAAFTDLPPSYRERAVIHI